MEGQAVTYARLVGREQNYCKDILREMRRVCQVAHRRMSVGCQGFARAPTKRHSEGTLLGREIRGKSTAED